jgi:hypothetical protein
MKSAGACISTLTATGILGLGVGATPALGQTHTLNLSAPSSTAVVGQTIIIQASGFNPQDPVFTFSSYLSIDAIPTSVLSTCPADYSAAAQIARETYAQGGEVVTSYQREDVDAAGNFSIPVAYVPRVAGRFLLCGYTDDAATTTLATASLILTVDAAAGPAPGPAPAPGAAPAPGPAAEPASVQRPRVRRSGRKLVCQRGSWSNNPSRYSYRWLVNGKRKRDARGRTLGVTRKLRGRKVQCRVTAANAAGATTAVSRSVRIR